VIAVFLFRGSAGEVVGFTVSNHGESQVCAAVSMLVINTVNSIETLTAAGAAGFNCEHEEEGYLSFNLKESPRSKDAGLLIDAMVLGLQCVKEQYPSQIEIIENGTGVSL